MAGDLFSDRSLKNYFGRLASEAVLPFNKSTSAEIASLLSLLAMTPKGLFQQTANSPAHCLEHKGTRSTAKDMPSPVPFRDRPHGPDVRQALAPQQWTR